MDKKKVFFVPGYFYLATEQFIEIARNLGDRADCTFVKVLAPGPSFNSVNSTYDQAYFSSQKMKFLVLNPFIHLGVISTPNLSDKELDPSDFSSNYSVSLLAKRLLIQINKLYGGKAISLNLPIREHTDIPIIVNICRFYYSTKRFVHYARNFIQMLILLPTLDKKNPFIVSMEELSKHKPDLVIVNSDLGHIGILYILEVCRLTKTEVLILPTCDIEIENTGFKHRFENYVSKILFNTKLLPKWSYMRANNFNSRVIGRFCLKSKILAPSDTIKSKLVSRGIDQTRIEVCSFPSPPPISFLESNTLQGPQTKKIVFYTECLHEIFDERKVVQAHYDIAEALATIERQFPVEVIVKPHPRELTNKTSLDRIILKPFSTHGIKVSTDIPTEKLISEAFLNIAHYSKVLITSCTLGRPILSLNLPEEDSVNTFLLPSDGDEVRVGDNSSLVNHITRLIEDPATFKDLVESTAKIGRRFMAAEGHRPVSEAILESLERPKKVSKAKN